MTEPIISRMDLPIVVGSGVAGLSAAIQLGSALVITTGRIGGGSSAWAQGGIAAAIGPGDDPESHAVDTLAVSAEIADPHIVRLLTTEGAPWIHRLVEMGAMFDRSSDGRIALGREAGHSWRRIVHARGDATGAELMRTLTEAVVSTEGIRVVEEAMVVDLVRSGPRVVGVLTESRQGELAIWLSSAVILATGGIGQLYARTTNPRSVDGTGVAIAARAGADLIDMEFVQFHPTALASESDPMPLLTEAIRGEGATIVDEHGRRIMEGVHRDLELAPRDVVARAIWREQQAGSKVYLDATAAVGAAFPDRFPTVWAYAVENSLDPRVEPLPVSPACHYFMGGVATDDHGRSSLPGLWACGETSSTGAHGANRLASNSLLEGLVFGARVGRDVEAGFAPVGDLAVLQIPEHPSDGGADDALRSRLRSIMWDKVGVVRSGAGLAGAIAELSAIQRQASSAALRGQALVATVIAQAALERTESRGGHFRIDYPDLDPSQAYRQRRRVEPGPDRLLVVESADLEVR